MSEFDQVLAEVDRQVARSAILQYFPQLVHDMMCDCESAKTPEALAVLILADWTFKEAMDAAYDAWTQRD